MKGMQVILTALLAVGLLCLLPVQGLAAEKSLADILKEKGVITEEEYQQVKQMEEAQKAEEAKKAEEAAKKVAAEKPAGLPLVGYNRGFFLQTPDGKFKALFAGYLRPELRLYENNTSQDNQFMIRQARFILDGFYGKYWQSRIAGEFSTPSDGKFLKYAYLNCSYLPDLQVRAGQFKAPFSREYLTSMPDVDTIERSMITENLVPKYDIGLMLHGPKVLGGVLNYGIGVFNGYGANNSDENDDKDLIARLVLAPFVTSDVAVVKGLEIGGSYQFGRQLKYEFQPKLPTDWAMFKKTTCRGDRERYGVDLAYKIGPFKLQGEYIYQRAEREKQVRVNPSTHKIVSSGGKLIDAPDLITQGWYVLGTLFVWGNEEKGVQLVGRYEQMDFDDKDASNDYLEANPVGKNSLLNPYGNELNKRGNTADVLSLGMNFFPMKNVKLAFNWFYQTMDNIYTTDKVKHDTEGNEYFTAKGGPMNAFYFLTQVRW